MDKLTKLTGMVKSLEDKLNRTKNLLSAERERVRQAQEAKPRKVPVGYVAIKIDSHGPAESERVRLYGKCRGGVVYEFMDLTGDEYKDRFKAGRHHDFCGPRFLRPSAVKRFNRLAALLRKLIEDNEVVPANEID